MLGNLLSITPRLKSFVPSFDAYTTKILSNGGTIEDSSGFSAIYNNLNPFIKANASWILIPGAYKLNGIYAIEPKTSNVRLIPFIRTSTTTKITKSGKVEVVPIGIPVTEYENGQLVGYRNERAVTNYIFPSSDFTSAKWTKTNVTVTSNVIASPMDGDQADQITETGADSIITILSEAHSATNSISQTVFVKRGNFDWIKLQTFDPTGTNGNYVWFNLATGTIGQNTVVGAGTFVRAEITSLADGWYRIGYTGGANSTTQENFSISSASANGSQTRATAGTYYAWGADVQFSSHITSHIPTTIATASRTASSFTDDVDIFQGLTDVALYMEAGWSKFGTATPHYLKRGTGTGTAAGYFWYDGPFSGSLQTRFISFDGLNTITNQENLPTKHLEITKAIVAYGTLGLRNCRSGGSVLSTSFDGEFGTGTLTTNTGNNQTPVSIIKTLAMIPQSLTNAQLQQITIP